MKGREKIEAAFSEDGARAIPVVIPYEGIFIRDHWQQLSTYPWWYRYSPDVSCQMLWRREVITRTGQDWFVLPRCYPRVERESLSITVREGGVFLLDERDGRTERLAEPQIGGWSESSSHQLKGRDDLPETPDDIDDLIPIPPHADPREMIKAGRNEVASRLLTEFRESLCPIYYVDSPLWRLCRALGFEATMITIATRTDLVEYACQRLLTLEIRVVREAALLGAECIWIAECLTDMISPEAFASLNVPILRDLVQEIRALGARSIYGYCGNPAGKLPSLISVGADALALEESKKGFVIDIEDVVDAVRGRCTVLGNLDAIDILQNGTEEQLRAEILRQIRAGRRNGSRCIVSLGSPVTPGTSAERVRLYCDLVHELGAS